MRGIPARIGRGIGKLDLFSTRGAEPQQQKGMRALWLDNVLAAISGAFLFTYVPLYALALGATNTQIGTLSMASHTTVVNVANIAGPILGGWVIDRLGYRRDFPLGLRAAAGRAFVCMAAASLFEEADSSHVNAMDSP